MTNPNIGPAEGEPIWEPIEPGEVDMEALNTITPDTVVIPLDMLVDYFTWRAAS